MLLTRVPSNFLLSPRNSLASRPALGRALETSACRQPVRTLNSPHAHLLFPCQAIPLTLVMSPVTPAPRREKQTDNSHQQHQIWGSGALGTVCTRRGVAPGPRRGSQNYSLLAGAQSVAKVLARSGQVVAGRGRQSSDLRGAALRQEDPHQWRPPGTTREPSSGECCPCTPARVTLLSEYSARLHFLCSPVPPEPQVTIFPRVPMNPELLLPLTPHRPPRGSAPSAVVPVPVRTARPVPTLVNQRPRVQQPEMPPEKGYRCPVGRFRGA